MNIEYFRKLAMSRNMKMIMKNFCHVILIMIVCGMQGALYFLQTLYGVNVCEDWQVLVQLVILFVLNYTLWISFV